MSRIFDPENKFWSFIGKIADVTCMSVLWAATSLPLVTLGASTTAFYAYTMRQVRDTEGGILSGYFGAFQQHFKKATLLWLLGPAMRGLVVGCAKLIFKQSMATENLLRNHRPYVFFAVSIFAGLVVSVLNTTAFYVDAKMFHYYTYELIFGVFWLRLLLAAASSLLMALVTLPVLAGVQHTNFALKKVKS